MAEQKPNSSTLIGNTLGQKYKLLDLLGSGGMADVYLGMQTGLNRRVAVKVMHPHLARTSGFKARFEREARILASLRHPNIIQIFDFDEDRGWYFMVMEYISSGTLTTQLINLHRNRKVMPLPDAYQLYNPICSALEYAHQNGMVHRDIKPENVLFTDKKEPVLTDFGIARIVGATQYTQTGTSTGTPSYMSPEQAKGEHGDERSDIYSLGVMLYEVVTGRLPYLSNTPFGVLIQHVNEPLPPPRKLNPNLPPAIDTVLYKAMAKEPNDRYQTPTQLAAALKSAIGIESAIIPPTQLKSSRPSQPVAPPPVTTAPVMQKQTIAEPAAAAPLPPPTKPQKSMLPWFVGGGVLVIVLLLALIVGLLVLNVFPGDTQSDGVSQTQTGTPAGSGVILIDGQKLPTATPTPLPSATPVPPTDTSAAPATQPANPTPEEETNTQLGETLALPIDTDTPIPQPTNTPTATETPFPATATLTPTPTAVSLSGRLVYVSDRDGDFELYLKSLDTNSPAVQLTNNSNNDWFPDWSSDERIVFTSNRTGNYDLYTMNADGGNQQPYVTTSAWDEYGNWQPGSNQVVFSTTADTNGTPNSELHRRNSDGSLTRLTTNSNEDRNPHWSAANQIFYAANPGGNWDIFVISANGGAPRNLTNRSGPDEDPTLSPDGSKLVFVRKEADSNGDGQITDADTGNIYVMNADGSGVRAVTNTNLDSSPDWSPDGAWVVFSRSAAPNSKTSNLYATRLSDGTTLQLTDDTNSANWGASWIQ